VASSAEQLRSLNGLSIDELKTVNAPLARQIEPLVRDYDAKQRLALIPLPDDVRAEVERIDFGDPKRDLLTAIKTALEAHGADEQAVKTATEAAAEAPAPAASATPAGNPVVASTLIKAEVGDIAAAARLSVTATKALGDAAEAPSAITDDLLTRLVAGKKLTAAKARTLGVATTVYQLSGENAALAEAVTKARPRASASDIAALSVAEWSEILGQNPSAVPPGATPDDMATTLAARLGAAFPGAAFFGRFPTPDPAEIERDLATLEPVFDANPVVIGVPLGSLELGSASDHDIASYSAAHERLTAAAGLLAGMDASSVFNDPHLGAEDKAAAVSRIAGLVTKVGANLGQIDLASLNLSRGSDDLGQLGIAGLGATETEQKVVLKTMQALQRALTVARNADDALALARSGFTSSREIARLPLSDFIRQSGLPADRATTVWERGRSNLADSALALGSIVDHFHVPWGLGNLAPSAEDYLKQLDGFQDLFGNLSLCACSECRSVLGPAAYFVDLMKYIEENLLSQFTTTGDPLHLKTRRPDLWTLELSCDNTNNRIALLDIVNPVFENFIARRRGYAGSLADRNAVEAIVYKTELATRVDSFGQPFVLPLARLTSYLADSPVKRPHVARDLGAPVSTVTKVELALAPAEVGLISVPDLNLGNLSHIYGVSFTQTGSGIDRVDAALFARAARISRSDLGTTLSTTFVRAGGATPAIAAAKLSSESVQNDVEWVQGLTIDALDRIHRFTRLRKQTGWSVTDLDLVLSTLGSTSLDAAALDSLATLHSVAARFGIDATRAAALFGPLSQQPAGSSLLDALFNTPPYVARDGAFPQPATRFVHPAFRQNTTAPNDPNVGRLLSGLRVTLDELATLARALAPHLAQEVSAGFDPDAASEDQRYFVLSLANLSLLYRHAELAQLLSTRIADLFELLGFLQLSQVASLADLTQLLDLADWAVNSGYTLDEIAVGSGAIPLGRKTLFDPASLATQIVSGASAALSFTATVFSVALGMSETGSSDLIAANPALIEATSDGRWRLVAGADLATAPIAIPVTATLPSPPSGVRPVTDAEVRVTLTPYTASEVLAHGIGTALSFDVGKVGALARLASQSFSSNAVVTAVRGDGPVAPLTSLLTHLLPVATVFAADVWDADALGFVQAHPDLFGTGPLPSLTPDAQHSHAPFVTVEQLQALSVYRRVAERFPGADDTADATAPVAADLRTVLASFDSTVPGFPPAVDSVVARVLGVPKGLVVGLRTPVALPAVAAPALDRLDRAAADAVALGLDGQTFGALVSDDYDTLAYADDALVAVIRTRITDEEALATKLDLIEQPVREAKRDALADYLIRSITPTLWTTLDELYEYFLIDAQAGGCETTSLVVAATMSAQLYVYRALMNLEQNDRPPADPRHFVLKVPPDAAAEWDWRKNYRVWEANRRVFLWPENYLIPDLRDNKTPLFEDIEKELLQTDLTDQDVLDAYTKYVSGLGEVASLTIAGAYREKSTSPSPHGDVSDVLHLFGCTADDPPTYYYRTCQNLIQGRSKASSATLWGPWQKVPVQIPSRSVAPVVFYGRLFVFWSDVKTKQKNSVSSGSSSFIGYQHQLAVHYTSLRPDGGWTAPQTLRLPPGAAPGTRADPYTSMLGPARGQINDPLHSPFNLPFLPKDLAKFDMQNRHQSEAIDDYTLSGPNWLGIWPMAWRQKNQEGLEIQYRNFLERRQVDLFAKTVFDLAAPWQTDASPPYPQILCAKNGGDTKPLYRGTPQWMPYPPNACANLMIDEVRMDIIERDTGAGTFKSYISQGLYAEQIATIPSQTSLLAIPGSVEDGLLQVGNDILLVLGSADSSPNYILMRIGTTIVEDIARRLFEDGVNAVLDIQTQYQLREAGIPITLVGGRITDHSNAGKLDFGGAYGTYYQELFLHLPWLIANALNARGSYAASATWYEHIFDPTSSDAIDITGVPPADVAHRLLDRVWKYRQFRGLDIQSLRSMLTDPTTIALYKSDPFNPWAISRYRISALQKAIVMAYVDNLLDWGDSLFTQFTMESVNEAMMLYIMASDILGPRPEELGDCGEGVNPNDYATIGPLVDASSEILVELETWQIGWRLASFPLQAASYQYVTDHQVFYQVANEFPLAATAAAAVIQPAVAPVLATGQTDGGSLFVGPGWNGTRTTAWAPPLADSATSSVLTARRPPARAAAPSSGVAEKFGGRTVHGAADKSRFPAWGGRFGWTVIRQVSTPAFCVPGNDVLLDYWDRVADRLYKIRHCQDINGNLAELALFAPRINPLLLVELQASGVSLDQVLGFNSGNLPPYRFSFLIERAKSFAATLSGFGASLLSAFERKDGEQLNQLRLAQQMNLARMTTQVRQAEIDAAQSELDSLGDQLAAAQYRSDYFAGLISTDRNPWEITQTVALHTSSVTKVAMGVLETLGGVLHLIPQVGSPFAMKYGGLELGNSLGRFANAVGATASFADALAASAGLEAGFERRREGWENLKTLADYDISVLKKRIKGAQLRLDIQNDAMQLHLKSIDQQQQLIDFANDKLTSLGLYTWLSGELKTMYRTAYLNVLSFAMLTQQAYRFERGDDTLPGLSMSYWDPAHAGLLAGEGLLIDLQSLEQRFLETNYRDAEIDQPFALSQIDPQALVQLRETGQCTFTVPEVFFDIWYPGYYKRRIKSARLTIPCITGPYVNVGAMLTLQHSWIRPASDPTAPLVEVPPSRSVSIATSTAQNDGGVFELSFHDERYMPFEGLGAVSQWQLRLPAAVPAFDYQTINDVVLSLSYTAEFDESLRATVDSTNATVVGGILHYLRNNTASRVISLRQDFSNSFTRLLRSPEGTGVTLTIGPRNFPFLVQGRNLSVSSATLLLRTASGNPPTGLTLTVDGTTLGGSAADAAFGNLPSTTLPPAFTSALYGDHTITVVAAGGLAPAVPVPGDVSAIDPEKLIDMLMVIDYRLQ
jgi:hypothetical protein